jgi:hypothetical protein
MASYYTKFMPNFSRIAATLHALLNANAPFECATEQELAFQKLKDKLVSRPIFQYPDFTIEFVLTTVESNGRLGAILSQRQIGKDLPVAYASRHLNKEERN